MEDIVDTVQKLLRGCDAPEIEIEARIRRQIVNKYSAQLLIENLDAEWDKVVYRERRQISKNNRKCTYRQRDSVTICKSSISRTDVNDMWCAVHVSVETPMPSMLHALDAIQVIEVTRYRAVLDGHFVDVVLSSDDPRVEVEVCDAASFDFEAMMNVVKQVCKELQGNAQFVGYYDWKTVMHVANTTFGPFCVERKQYQKPRTMTVDVLFRIAKSIYNDPHSVCVTPKVDGTRKFIVTANGLAFSLGTAKDVRHEGTFDKEGVTVLDCEYADGTYHIFDIPVDGGVYCGNESLDDRLTRMEAAMHALQSSAEIHIKPYETFGSFDRLQSLYEAFVNKYDMDGLIFAETNGGYMQTVHKWKMHSTVDLEVEDYKLMTCDGFEVSMTCDSLPPEKRFGVWEFAYEDNKLIFKRHRPDKHQGNSKHIVLKNIFDSVPGTLFTGKGFYLMRKYHNRVKRQVITDAKDAKATFLDIGTGQGGDIGKWNRALEVYCVEPNVDSLYEMRDRCSDEMWNKITAISARLANVNPDLVSRKVDIFTAFFCMNQFEDSDWKMLEHLIKTKGSKKCRLLAIAMTSPKEHRSAHLEIRMRGEDRYNIKMHDTRIMDIDERVVQATFIDKLAKKCNMKQVKQSKLDGNDFMTKEERRLSSMYTLFVYHKF